MKIKIMVLVLAAAMLFASCSGTPKTIEIELTDGTTVEISTDGLSDEQIEAMQEAAESGETQSLMLSGLFTMEELSELGISFDMGGMGGGMQNGEGGQPGGDMMQEMDYSDVDIDELNTEDLTDEQIAALEQLIAGEVTLQELIDDEIFTNDEIVAIGLSVGGMGGDIGGGFSDMEIDFTDVDLDTLDLSELSDEQIEILGQLVAGEITFDEATADGVLTMEDLQNLGIMTGTDMGEMPDGEGMQEGGQPGEGGGMQGGEGGQPDGDGTPPEGEGDTSGDTNEG